VNSTEEKIARYYLRREEGRREKGKGKGKKEERRKEK
jgi:hypothetical protein